MNLRTQLLSETSKQWFRLLHAKVIVSKSVDPYFNLALEDFLYSNSKSPRSLIIYTNTPSVIIGRNQNPWVESNVRKCRSNLINIIRRKSGGGTVFHDLGNVNYSLLTDRNEFSHTKGAELIIKALQELNVGAELNQRHDIVLKETKQKISGSAYKISKGKAYHHGTMLLKSDLGEISKYLKSSTNGIISKGVSSTRSQVGNVELARIDFMMEAILSFLRYDFARHSPKNNSSISRFNDLKSIDSIPEDSIMFVNSDDLTGVPHILRTMQELKSWDWTFGQTPFFQQFLTTKDLPIGDHMVALNISVRHGIIENFSFSSSNDHLQQEIMNYPWKGMAYELGFVNSFTINNTPSSEALVVLDWVSKNI
ncbi:lipoate-protein ligase A [Schizosaccharomyces cryophilus OY26]|uniref:Putative lipoate-protein ligase A n=1 Tax=Schizosaccharomyces cryophilus (strain OY26 / ATCC MYA-4695 / CBS 11777 / NBRC 106824 / NRRL Y48691) TaxID=653667 RepID=S9WWY5_SCHCR|nr:lipoate-protein ligase A [Schizosaccharomyces cryophilus OY26]EPY49247.1 lipoate-protein ligase A [Schizosaccharomyces cryophilus OY26]